MAIGPQHKSQSLALGEKLISLFNSEQDILKNAENKKEYYNKFIDTKNIIKSLWPKFANKFEILGEMENCLKSTT